MLVTGDKTSPAKYFWVLDSFMINTFQITTLWKFVFHKNALLSILNFIQAEAQFLPGGLLKVRQINVNTVREQEIKFCI